jgi:hypothetical protein
MSKSEEVWWQTPISLKNITGRHTHGQDTARKVANVQKGNVKVLFCITNQDSVSLYFKTTTTITTTTKTVTGSF